MPDFRCGFCLPLREKRIALDPDAKTFRPQLIHEQGRKIRRYDERSNAFFMEQQVHHVDHRRASFPLFSQFPLINGKRQYLIDRCLFFGAVNLEIAHYDALLVFVLEEDKRIRHEEPCRIKHVGIAFAGRHDKVRLVGFEAGLRRGRWRFSVSFCLDDFCPEHVHFTFAGAAGDVIRLQLGTLAIS